MTNLTQDAQTREKQQLAVAVLDELLSLDLPVCSWSLFNYLSELSGQVEHELNDADKRAAIERWAKVLKTQVTERRPQNTNYGTLLRAIGEYENVTVCIFGYVDAPDEAER